MNLHLKNTSIFFEGRKMLNIYSRKSPYSELSIHGFNNVMSATKKSSRQQLRMYTLWWWKEYGLISLDYQYKYQFSYLSLLFSPSKFPSFRRSSFLSLKTFVLIRDILFLADSSGRISGCCLINSFTISTPLTEMMPY